MTLVLTHVDAEERIATLTLNQPERRNPTSIALLDTLATALEEVAGAGVARVLLVCGAGRSFCSGLDLDEVMADEGTVRTLLTKLSAVMRQIRRMPLVTIACVQGAAIGGGFGFMVACDFKVTHAEAKLGYPPLETCLSPALMAPWLVRTVGPARARVMLLSGGTITGTEALAAGVATHLVEAGAIDDTARELARHVNRGGAFATTAMKGFLNELDESIDDHMLDRAAAISGDVMTHPESRRRITELFGSS